MRSAKVRPPSGAARPALTETRYCVYDEPHRDYLYTDAWVRKLARDLRNAEVFETVTGHEPEPIVEKAAA